MSLMTYCCPSTSRTSPCTICCVGDWPGLLQAIGNWHTTAIPSTPAISRLRRLFIGFLSSALFIFFLFLGFPERGLCVAFHDRFDFAVEIQLKTRPIALLETLHELGFRD